MATVLVATVSDGFGGATVTHDLQTQWVDVALYVSNQGDPYVFVTLQSVSEPWNVQVGLVDANEFTFSGLPADSPIKVVVTGVRGAS